MPDPIRVCLFATTFQANIFSLTKYLATDDRFEVIAVVPGLSEYQREPIYGLMPPRCRLIDSEAPTLYRELKAFAPLVTVVDNHYPKRVLSPNLMNVWHGFGWRGPEDRTQFAEVHRSIWRHTGRKADVYNPNFRWITAGETNRRHRIDVTGFHPDSVLALGQAYVDDVVSAPFRREQLLDLYPESFQGRKIALFAPTWHFGRIFSHLGEDLPLLERLFSFLDKYQVALIMRMHDQKRFEQSYTQALVELAQKYPNVLLKWKDQNQDNLLDLCVSDLMLSNYSSILTYFYATERPTIHLYPVDRHAEGSVGRVLKGGKVQTVQFSDKDYIWSLPAEQTGGLVADTLEQFEAAILQALASPDCCREQSRAFMAAHCASADGQTCRRIADALVELSATPAAPRRFGWLRSWWEG